MSTYVIGDVQGCCDELKALLKLIQFDVNKDRLWFVGDLVNRGPDSLGVLRLVKKYTKVSQVVLGNHDLHLLAVAYGNCSMQSNDTFNDVLQAEDGQGLLDWLRQQPLLHYDPSFNTVMTHAGIYPHWDLSYAQVLAQEVMVILRESPQLLFAAMYGDQPAKWDGSLQGEARWRFIVNALTRMRYLTRDGQLDLTETGPVGTQSKELLPWFELPRKIDASIQIVFGHWAALAGQVAVPNIQALDTGCVWGSALTALRLEDNKRFSVGAN